MFKLEKFYKLQEKELAGEGSAAAELEPEADKEVEAPKTVSYEEYQKALDSIARLEKHTNTLLGEKKEADQKRREAQELAEQQEIEASKKANNFEEFERQLNTQFETKETNYKAKIEAFESKLIGQSQKAAQADFVADFVDQGTATLALDKMIKVTLDDELNPVREFRDLQGNLITTDPKVFKEYLEANHASWLKGAQSSGGLDSAQKPASSGSQAVPNKPFDQLNTTEKVAYLKAKKK